MTSARPTVLVVDDERSLLSLLSLVFETEGYRVICVSNGREALRQFSAQPIDVVVLDYLMPVMNGGEVARQMRAINPAVPIIMLSASLTVPEDTRALVNEFVQKGMGTDALLQAVQRALAAKPPDSR